MRPPPNVPRRTPPLQPQPRFPKAPPKQEKPKNPFSGLSAGLQSIKSIPRRVPQVEQELPSTSQFIPAVNEVEAQRERDKIYKALIKGLQPQVKPASSLKQPEPEPEKAPTPKPIRQRPTSRDLQTPSEPRTPPLAFFPQSPATTQEVLRYNQGFNPITRERTPISTPRS